MIALPANPDRVRSARPDDEAELLELCRRNHQENGLGPFAPDKVRSVFRRAFDAAVNDRCIIGVAGAHGVEGSIGLMIDEPWDGDALILRSLWHYVLPEHRPSTTHFRDLMAFAKRLADPAPVGIGIPLSAHAVVHARTEAQIKLYRRQLGDPIAVTWLCESSLTGAH